ncbi:RPA-interacting protein isoform X2 [Prionailurus iriomotensis]
MRNSRDRLLNRYRQAGGGVPGSAQSTLLVHEVMEEEWSALRSVEGRPEVSAQLEEPVDLAVLEEIQQELADQEEYYVLGIVARLPHERTQIVHDTDRAYGRWRTGHFTLSRVGWATAGSALLWRERSIISEYEKSLQFDERCLSIILAEWEANPLICPVCTKSNLRVANGVVTCPCGLYLSNHFPELTEQRLRACIEDSVNAHSAHCPHTPEFSVTQATGERPTLLMSCLGL